MPKPGPAPKIQLQVPSEFKLDNGLTVMVVENKKLPRVSYQLRIDNMPTVEGDKAGISSILGAMLGNGTTSISKDDFNEEVDFLGATMNFSSDGGFVSGLSKYSERLLELMADATINPLLVEEEFNKEKEKQLEGLKFGENDVATIATRVKDALSYGVHHPYGEFASETTIKNLNLSNVIAFYEKRFNPENAYLVIIGDVDAQVIENQVKKYFGTWKSKVSTQSNLPKPSANVQFAQINFVDMPNAVQSNIIVTNNVTLKMGDTDYHAALLANYIFGGSATGYLFQNLRDDKGYTYGSYSGIGASRYGASRFQATAEVRNEVTDSSVVEMLKEIKRIRTEPVNYETLEAAKAAYTGTFVMALERPQTIANYALNIKLNDLPSDFYKNFLKNINAVTVEDVNKAANTYFMLDNARIIVVGKGSDVIENLEKTKIPIKYFDKNANPVAKPEFSKPIPDGVTAQSVINKYITAIGGKDKLMAVKTTHSKANVTIEGAPFKPTAEIKRMAPNMESMEMTIEGMGTVMKQKFNGESGYTEQQGMKTELTADQITEKKAESGIFPELEYDSANMSIESMTTIDGKDVFKIKITMGDKVSYRYYDADNGYLIRVEATTEQQGQAITSVVDYSNYSPVNGVLFPYNQKVISGPQTIMLNISNIKVNEGVSEDDFN